MQPIQAPTIAEVDDLDAPISSRDGRRHTSPVPGHFDASTWAFYRDHLANTALLHFIKSNIPEPHCAEALTCLVEKPCFRADPRRLDTLLATLERYHHEMTTQPDTLKIPADRRPAVIARVLYGIVKHSASLYMWQDNPDVHPEQRELLREEIVLPMVLRILALDIREPHIDDPSDRLEELARRFVALSQRMVGAHLLKKSRSEVVLAWCHINITDTTQRYLDPSGHPCFSPELAARLANIKVRLVIFNILLDELADDVQDGDLFELFSQIPYNEEGALAPVSPERLEALQSAVPRSWADYLTLAVDVWNSSLRQLKAVVGEAAFEKHAGELRQDYDLILYSMKTSLHLNRGELQGIFLSDDLGKILSHNMNMMAFATLDRMAIEYAAPGTAEILHRDPELEQVIRRINQVLQHNGQIANSSATLEAEIDENCAANEIVTLAGDHPDGSELMKFYQLRAEALYHRDMKFYFRAAQNIRDIIVKTNARAVFLQKWVTNREQIQEILNEHPRIYQVLDIPRTLTAHDALLVMSWVYRGDI